ncbi:MAG: PilZ domain-containing protein [Myxococcota bacterium]|nr:PilZ domain-containing protein [Myxococcota bacterium]
MRFRDLVRMGVERLNGDRSRRTPESGAPSQDASERRDEVRVDRFGWARYQAGDAEGQGLVTNLSQTGAMVERCSEPLDPGTKLVLRLKPAGGFKTVSVDAEVVRATEEGFALRFVETSEAANELLAEVIGIALGDTLPL